MSQHVPWEMGGSSENTPGEFERVTVRNVSVQIIVTELTHMDFLERKKVHSVYFYSFKFFTPK